MDRRGYVKGTYIPGASNPGVMREDIGGGALNALRGAVQLGIDCTMLSVRGGDSQGESVAQAITEAGIIDMSVTFLDRATPSYTALLDPNGDLIAGLADMSLYDIAFPKQITRSGARTAIAAHDAILCDGNVPQSGLERITNLAQANPLYAIAVSPAKIVRFRSCLTKLKCLFMNVREAQALTGAQDANNLAARLRDSGLGTGVVTNGDDVITVFDGSDEWQLRPPASQSTVDVTGAGDALAGATVSALLKGQSLTEAVRYGVAAALLTLECAQTVALLSADAINRKLATVPQIGPRKSL
ncbi:MAG: carbohydrate kinase family protein [Rhizobiaceae bacterium]|nr:carbohydrate kinase family protein [Rhizobiaceae bacterium]